MFKFNGDPSGVEIEPEDTEIYSTGQPLIRSNEEVLPIIQVFKSANYLAMLSIFCVVRSMASSDLTFRKRLMAISNRNTKSE